MDGKKIQCLNLFQYTISSTIFLPFPELMKILPFSKTTNSNVDPFIRGEKFFYFEMLNIYLLILFLWSRTCFYFSFFTVFCLRNVFLDLIEYKCTFSLISVYIKWVRYTSTFHNVDRVRKRTQNEPVCVSSPETLRKEAICFVSSNCVKYFHFSKAATSGVQQTAAAG